MAKKDIDRIKLFIREGEGLTLEFKERFTPHIDEDLVAFANTRGGTLLLGVRDDGAISGERLNNDLKGRINSLARNCQPPIAVEKKPLEPSRSGVMRSSLIFSFDSTR